MGAIGESIMFAVASFNGFNLFILIFYDT